MFGSHGLLITPMSDSAPVGWGDPHFDVSGDPIIPGTIGGANPVVLLDYDRANNALRRKKWGWDKYKKGNCYWIGANNACLSWVGPWGYNIAPSPSPVYSDELSVWAYYQNYDVVYTNGWYSFPRPNLEMRNIYRDGAIYAISPSDLSILGACIYDNYLVVIVATASPGVYQVFSKPLSNISSIWFLSGNITIPAAPSNAVILPQSGCFSFSADGANGAIVIYLGVNVPSYEKHFETILCRVFFSINAENLVFSTSFTSPSASSILIHELTTEQSLPNNSSTRTAVRDWTDLEGELIFAVGYRGTNEIVLSVKNTIVNSVVTDISDYFAFGIDGSGDWSLSIEELQNYRMSLFENGVGFATLFDSQRHYSATGSQYVRNGEPREGNSISTEVVTNKRVNFLFTDVHAAEFITYLTSVDSYSSVTLAISHGINDDMLDRVSTSHYAETFRLQHISNNLFLNPIDLLIGSIGSNTNETVNSSSVYAINKTPLIRLPNYDYDGYIYSDFSTIDCLKIKPTVSAAALGPNLLAATLRVNFPPGAALTNYLNILPNGETPSSLLSIPGSNPRLADISDGYAPNPDFYFSVGVI